MKGKLQTSLWRAPQTTLASVDPVQGILRKFNGELRLLEKTTPAALPSSGKERRGR